MPDNKDSSNYIFNIKDLFAVAQSKWYILVLSVLLCTVVTYIYSCFFITPLYNSTGKIYIMNKNTQDINTGDLSVSSYLTRDYENLIADTAVLDEVASKLGNKYSSSFLHSAVSVTNPENTRFIEITVRTPSAKDSKKIVDCICEVSQEKIVELLGIDQVTIVRKGNISRRASVPNISGNVIKGLLFGIVAYAIAVSAIFFLNDKINTPEDVQKCLGLNVLGIIPYNQSRSKVK